MPNYYKNYGFFFLQGTFGLPGEKGERGEPGSPGYSVCTARNIIPYFCLIIHVLFGWMHICISYEKTRSRKCW